MSRAWNYRLTTTSKLSDEYDEAPWRQKITQQIATALQERKEWTLARWLKPDDMQFGRDVRLLDYACGTGSITKALGPWVSVVRGIDVSESMVNKFNEAARSSGLKPETVNAVVGDLLADEVPDHLNTAEYYDFDVAVIGLGFHHFENPVLAVERIAERLKPANGVLLVIDFLPFDQDEHGNEMSKTIKTSGFARSNMEKLYKIAKLDKFSFSVIDDPAVMELQEGTKKRTMFVARGIRQPTMWGKIANWVYDMQMEASKQTSHNYQNNDTKGQGLGMFGETYQVKPSNEGFALPERPERKEQ